MTTQLESARAKVLWSIDHYETLARACQAFTDSTPHEVTVKFDADVGYYVARFHVRQQPSADLSLILGDLIHNVRSALDHAAWQVALLENSGARLRRDRSKISFPITQRPEEFARHPILAYVSEAAKAVFERAQPYNGPDGPEHHWLAIVNRMWNADKHRLLHPTFALTWIGKTGFVPAAIDVDDLLGGVEIESVIREEDGIEDGAEVAHIRFTSGPRPHMQEVRVKTQPPAHVVFGSGQDTCSLRMIGTFCASALQTLDRLEDLFADDTP